MQKGCYSTFFLQNTRKVPAKHIIINVALLICLFKLNYDLAFLIIYLLAYIEIIILFMFYIVLLQSQFHLKSKNLHILY